MVADTSFHEDLARADAVKIGSSRAFGIVFAVVFALIGLWPLIADGAVRIWALGVSAVFLTLALVWPRTLDHLNRLWFLFGLLLHKIVNPLIMGLLFYITVTPIALIMRLMGKDPLRLKFDRSARTYWMDRTPPGPPPETMRRQF